MQLTNRFYDAFEKLRIAALKFRHVSQSARKQLGSHEMDFLEIFYLWILRKSVEKKIFKIH